jgi:hypothetical protein
LLNSGYLRSTTFTLVGVALRSIMSCGRKKLGLTEAR